MGRSSQKTESELPRLLNPGHFSVPKRMIERSSELERTIKRFDSPFVAVNRRTAAHWSQTEATLVGEHQENSSDREQRNTCLSSTEHSLRRSVTRECSRTSSNTSGSASI